MNLAGLAFTEVTTSITLVIAVVGVIVGGLEYRHRREVGRAQRDVELAKLFADLVPIANGRGDATLSEAAVEHLVTRPAGPPVDARGNLDLRSAKVISPIGDATQAAAIASIGNLGVEHAVLREPAWEAIEALQYIMSTPNTATYGAYVNARARLILAG